MNLKIINNYYNVYRDAILRTSDIINNTAYIDVGVYTRGGEIYDDTHFSGNTADFLDSNALLDDVKLYGNFYVEIGYVNVTNDIKP